MKMNQIIQKKKLNKKLKLTFVNCDLKFNNRLNFTFSNDANGTPIAIESKSFL